MRRRSQTTEREEELKTPFAEKQRRKRQIPMSTPLLVVPVNLDVNAEIVSGKSIPAAATTHGFR